jgi:preprotein translocase subunit YajC
MMSGLWNEIVGLIGVLLIISIFLIMVASPEQIQQLLNTLITGLIMALIIAPAIAITLILIIREYKKRETEW